MSSLREFDITVRPRLHQEVSDVDAADVGIQSLFCLDAVLTLLSMVDGRRVGEIFEDDGASLALWHENIAGICLAFSSEAIKRLDQLEAALKKSRESAPNLSIVHAKEQDEEGRDE